MQLKHFPKDLSLEAISASGEQFAYEVFCKVRWPEANGQPICRKCGCDRVYSLSTRRIFKCKNCYHQFTPTSGTIFNSRKMSFVQILTMMKYILDKPKGVTIVELCNEVGFDYKTGFDMMQKMRKTLEEEAIL